MDDPSGIPTGEGWGRSLVALGVLTLVRVVVAGVVPLAPDEAYYWVWSRALQPGYLDHPPMVAVWIWVGTGLVGPAALGVRLLGPVSALLGTLMLADAGERLFPGRGVGLRAAALLNATLMVGAGSVTMTPDTPLLFFAVMALWALVRAGESGRWWWIVAGAAIGAGVASKYTGVLVGFGAVVWLGWTRPRALRSGWVWAGGVVAVTVFAPVIVWNWEHDWASFLKQGGRAGDWRPARAVQFLGELVAGQVGLATPGVFVLFAAGLGRAARGAWRRAGPETLLAALAGPGLVIFAEHALGDRVQANWLALLYPPLAIGAAIRSATAGRRWWRGAAWVGLGVTAAVYVQASAGVLPLGRADPTSKLAGWGGLAREAEAMRVWEGAGFIASEEYSEASELAWRAPAGAVVVGAERRWGLFRLSDAPAGTGLLLISERRREGPDPAMWEDAAEIGGLVRVRGGVEAERFRVYRVRLRSGAAAKVLPRPGGV